MSQFMRCGADSQKYIHVSDDGDRWISTNFAPNYAKETLQFTSLEIVTEIVDQLY